MASDPQFASTPARFASQVSAANPNRDGTGTLVDILTAASTGTRVFYVEVCAIATTTAGMIRLYVFNGTTTRLYDEILVTAVTASATTKAFRARLDFPVPFILPTTFRLQASTENAATFNIHVGAASL